MKNKMDIKSETNVRTTNIKNKHLIVSVVVALAGFLPQSNAQGILNTAGSFAVLGGSTVTSAGNTVVNGDLGVSPGVAITGFGPGIVNGTTYAGGSVAAQAQTDALAEYNILTGETPSSNLTGQDLGGLVLAGGVYQFDAAAQLTGILTLTGDGSSRFDFLIGSTLTTAVSSSILLLGVSAENVYWQVGSSATIGVNTAFNGSILANQSITMNAGADVSGRLLALNGAVTLDANVITVPEPASFWLLALCAFVFGVRQRLSMWRRKAGRS